MTYRQERGFSRANELLQDIFPAKTIQDYKFESERLFDTINIRWRCHCTKMKFSIKGFFNKCDQIRSFLRISLHLLNKSLMENFIFCAVCVLFYLTGYLTPLFTSLLISSFFSIANYIAQNFLIFKPVVLLTADRFCIRWENVEWIWNILIWKSILKYIIYPQVYPRQTNMNQKGTNDDFIWSHDINAST